MEKTNTKETYTIISKFHSAPHNIELTLYYIGNDSWSQDSELGIIFADIQSAKIDVEKLQKLFPDIAISILKTKITSETEIINLSVTSLSETPVLNNSIYELHLSARATSLLLEKGKRTIGDVVQMNDIDLYALKGFGRKPVRDLKKTLKSMNLSLGMVLKLN